MIIHMSRRSHVTQPRAHDNHLHPVPSSGRQPYPKRTLHIKPAPPEAEMVVRPDQLLHKVNPYASPNMSGAQLQALIHAARSLGYDVDFS